MPDLFVNMLNPKSIVAAVISASFLFFSFPVLAEEGTTLQLAYRYPTNSIMNSRINLIANQVFVRTGITLEFVEVPAKRSLALANSGDFLDGEAVRISALGESEKYQNLIRIDVPLGYGHLVGLHKNRLLKSSLMLSVLKNKSVCYMKGQLVSDNLANKLDLKNVVNPTSTMQVVKMVAAERCDVGFYVFEFSTPEVLEFFYENDINFTVVIEKAPFYMYLNKSKEKMIPKIKAALMDMESDGILESLSQSSQFFLGHEFD